MSTANGNGQAPKVVRCAIYTRKSTSEGLDTDVNTLDAQREAAQHYIKSLAAQGWVVLPARYDDGGFTGGNLERPALQRLLGDIDRGEVDTVVVYQGRSPLAQPPRLRAPDGDLREEARGLRLHHAALRHVDLDGAAGPETCSFRSHNSSAS